MISVENFSENNFIRLYLPSLKYKYNIIRLTSVTGAICRNRFTIFQSHETRNCRACDRMSKIAYRVCSYARDLRWQYIFRWRVSNTVLTNSTRARTHARTYTPAMFIRRNIDARRCYAFYVGQKAIETDRRVANALRNVGLLRVRQRTFCVFQRKNLHGFIIGNERLDAEQGKQIEDKVLALWKEALNLGSCYTPTDFELI